MGRIIKLPDFDGFVNDGEREVVEKLAAGTPDEFLIYPNVELPVDNGQILEYDAIVVAADRVWSIETKRLAGDVVFGLHDFTVNGDSRRHPVKSINLKAKKLKGLYGRGAAAGVWCQGLVILAIAPRTLEVDPSWADHVKSIEDAVAVLSDPVANGHQKRQLLVGRARDAVIHALGLDVRSRSRRQQFGAYVVEALHVKHPNAEWWHAHHEITGQAVLLEVLQRPSGGNLAAWRQRVTERRDAVAAADTVRGSSGVHVPDAAFHDDDGSLVVVHRASIHGSLDDLGDDVARLAEQQRRRLVLSIAGALRACRAASVSHRLMSPLTIRVDERTGQGWLTGFQLATGPGRPGRHRTKEEWSAYADRVWLSPEQQRGEAVGPESDQYGLGRLLQHLWSDGLPEDLRPFVERLLSDAPAARPAALDDLVAHLTAQRLAAVGAQPTGGAVDAGPVEGRTWAGYAIEERLGTGLVEGVNVWLARGPVMDERVVLRVYDTDLGVEPARRFMVQLGKRKEQGLANVLSADVEGDRAFVVSEHIVGASLRDELDEKGPFTVDAAATVASRVLTVLDRIHPVRDGSGGVTHQRISLDNVLNVEGRGPVLVNLGLAPAGESQVAVNVAANRPPDVAVDPDDPDADLFAVGVLLHELVTGGRHPYVDGRPDEAGPTPDPACGTLAPIIARACAARRADRFPSAAAFLDELLALGLAEVLPVPVGDDVRVRHLEVRALIRARRWDEADALCDPSWTATRDHIAWCRERYPAGSEHVMVEVGGFRLSRSPARDAEGVEFSPTDSRGADARVLVGSRRGYFIEGPDGVALELMSHVAPDGEGIVLVSDVFESPAPFSGIRTRLRIGIKPTPDGRRWMELRRATRTTNGHGSSVKQTTRTELERIAGAGLAPLFERFGRVDIGTRQQLFGETNKRKNELAVVFEADEPDVPAVAFLASRILTLAGEGAPPG